MVKNGNWGLGWVRENEFEGWKEEEEKTLEMFWQIKRLEMSKFSIV